MTLSNVIDELSLIGAEKLWGDDGERMLRKASEEMARYREDLEDKKGSGDVTQEDLERAEDDMKEIFALQKKAVVEGIRAVMKELGINASEL